MKFHYSDKKLNRAYFGWFVGSLFIAAYLWFDLSYIGEGGIRELVQRVEFYIGLVLLIYSVVHYYRFYEANKNTYLTINENSVSQFEKANKIEIKWSEITEVVWTTLEKSYIQCIIIKSDTKQIIIGEKITGLPTIIRMIKDRVGSKFDTRDIPLEIKYSKND